MEKNERSSGAKRLGVSKNVEFLILKIIISMEIVTEYWQLNKLEDQWHLLLKVENTIIIIESKLGKGFRLIENGKRKRNEEPKPLFNLSNEENEIVLTEDDGKTFIDLLVNGVRLVWIIIQDDIGDKILSELKHILLNMD